MGTTQTTPTVKDVVGTWSVDRAHSTAEFTAKHMMISTVRGAFLDFEGTFVIDEDPERASVEAVIRTASIQTNDPRRDDHLRSGDFLETERFPEMRFRSTRVEVVSEEDRTFRIEGELTVRDVTRPLTLDASVEGWRLGADGTVERLAFVARGQVRRKDFDLTWNQVLETGGVLVSDRVGVELNITAVPAGS
jgi:polyisoprenoid-binding protein YceI